VGERPLIRDPAHRVAGPEIGDVEIDHPRACQLEVDEDVDVLVQDVGVVVERPVRRDPNLLELDVQADVAGHRHEHGRERQAVAPLGPERLGRGPGPIVIGHAERFLVDDRSGQLLQLDVCAAGAVYVGVKEGAHFRGEREHLPLAGNGR
jgi:hypothetical protein